jgi:DnaJ family protein B protein 4
MGRGGRNPFSFDDVDLSFGGGAVPGGLFGSMGGMPGGFSRTGPQPQRKASTKKPESAASEITRPLKVKLEDLLTGTTKRLKITRKLLTEEHEERVIEIDISPGYKAGTKIRFPHAGNEREGEEAQDLVFVVEEAPHDKFTRDGNNLITIETLTLVDALTGTGSTRTITGLDGKRVPVPVPVAVVKPGAQTKIPGHGMPVRKEGQVRSRGDLIVKWDIVFPDKLSTSQRDAVRAALS